MALLVKQLVTRSGVLCRRPAVATTRFLSINGGVRDSDSGFESRGSINGCHEDVVRGGALTAMSSYEVFMNRFRATSRWLSRCYRILITEDRSTTWIIPARLREDAEYLKVDVYISTDGPESTNISVDHNTVYVEARNSERKEKFICWFDLPDIDSTVKIYKASDIKAVLRVQLGYLELIIPKLKKEEMKYTPDVKTIMKGR